MPNAYNYSSERHGLDVQLIYVLRTGSAGREEMHGAAIRNIANAYNVMNFMNSLFVLFPENRLIVKLFIAIFTVSKRTLDKLLS